MTTKSTKKHSRKTILITVIVLALMLCANLGTMAWLTVQDSVTNTFTVGNFNKPDTSNPETPDKQPGTDPEKPNIGLGGYIIEPSWDIADVAEYKLVPGVSLYKDPYVVLGKGSEDAVIYVYVDNPFGNNSVYFKLNDSWEAVSGRVTTAGKDSAYVKGLFKYVGKDSAGIM